MKKKSKGTSLVEIMISLAMISVVVLFMFNILTDLKAEDRDSTRDSKDSIERTSYTRIIQNDFITKKLTKVQTCSVTGSLLCYDFTFQSGASRLIINTNSVVYGDEIWTIDSTTFNKDRVKACKKDVGNNSLFKLIIPTNSNVYSSRKMDLELTYTSVGYKITTNFTANQCD